MRVVTSQRRRGAQVLLERCRLGAGDFKVQGSVHCSSYQSKSEYKSRLDIAVFCRRRSARWTLCCDQQCERDVQARETAEPTIYGGWHQKSWVGANGRCTNLLRTATYPRNRTLVHRKVKHPDSYKLGACSRF